MTPQELADKFEEFAQYNAEHYAHTPAGVAAAEVWRQAADYVRRHSERPPIIAQELAAECDALKAELYAARRKVDRAFEANRQNDERIASRDETIKQLRFSLKLADASNGALRGMVDCLNIENTKLKGLGT